MSISRKIFKNLKLFTMDNENHWYESGYIETMGDKIITVGDIKDCPDDREKEAEVIDCHGGIVIPGMITSHSHFYGQFARGMAVKEPMHNWQQILSHMWWRMDKALTPEQNYYSAMMGMIEGLKAGTTCYFDHQASPNAVDGCLDLLEQAAKETGARVCLSYEVSDRDGLEHRKSGVKENIRFIKKMQKKKDPRIRAMFGMHASYTLDDETLEICASAARELGVGIHIHVAEDAADVFDSYRRCDRHVVERLADAGILGPGTIAAHCVHTGPEEWKMFRETGTTVAHNARSNTNNGVGICPAVRMMDAGVKVTLGGDGYTYDSFAELSMAVMMQHLREKDPEVFSGQQVKDYTYGYISGLTEDVFGCAAGVIRPGALADFLVLDYNEPVPLTEKNVFSHMTAGFSGHVRDVIIGGEIVVHGRRCTKIDEEKILAECRSQAEKLRDRLG